MKPRMALKIAVDIAMTVVLMFLMTYELIGRSAHEWIGIAMFVLLVLHHVLNGKWSRSILKGRYTSLRVLQSLLVLCVLLSMTGSMISGIILSEHAFTFLQIRNGRSWARTWHMVCSYWGFVFMSLHLGFHWNTMMNMAKKRWGQPSSVCTWVLRAIAITVAVYGIHAFVFREIGTYMVLQNEFAFFDYEEPLLLFLLDYMAVMELFVLIGHYGAECLRRIRRKRK